MRQKALYVLIGLILFFALPIAWDAILTEARYATPIFIILVGVFWLVLRSLENRAFPIPMLALPWFIYLTWLAMLLSVSPIPFYGLDHILQGLVVFLGFWIFTDSARSEGSSQTWEAIFISIGFVFTLIDLLSYMLEQWQWWNISGTIFSSPPVVNRLTGSFLGHPNIVGGYLNLIIPFVFIYFLRPAKAIRRIFWLMVIGTFFFAQFLTSSRSAWLGLAASILLMSIMKYSGQIDRLRKRTGWRLTRQSLPKVIVVGSLLVLVVALMSPVLIRQVKLAAHGTIYDRQAIWEYTLTQIGDSPIWGHGPGSVPFLMALRSEAIGGDEAYHTHNVVLEALTTSGIIGLAILAWAVLLTIRAFYGAWKKNPPGCSNRDTLIACAGIAVGLAIQNLLDYRLSQLRFTAGALLPLAFVYSLAPLKEHLILSRRIALPLLIVLFTTSTFGTWYTKGGDLEFSKGIDAAISGNWPQAQEKTCRAAEKSPMNTFFQFQCGLASARVAWEHDDLQSLEAVVIRQKQTLDQDPYWYIHWANLASYEWELGEHEEALEQLQKAVDMAPKKQFLWLNLGWMQENLGNLPEAQAAYQIAYCLNPWYRNSVFFQETALRKAVLSGECPSGYDLRQSNDFQRTLWEGIDAFDGGNLTEAKDAFLFAQQINPIDPYPYMYLGLIEMESGNLEEARKLAQTSVFVYDRNARIWLMAASIAQGLGQDTEAVNDLSRAFDLVTKFDPPQVFYIWAYRHLSLPKDLSPYYKTVGWSPDTISAFQSLSDSLIEQGKIDQAIHIRNWIELNAKFH